MRKWMVCLHMTAFVVLTCTGCWDSTDIDRLAIVTETGVDVPDSGQEHGQSSEGDTASIGQFSRGQSPHNVRLTVQLARPSDLGTTGGGGSPSASTGTTDTFILEQGQDVNALAAYEQVRKHQSRRLFLGQRKVVVLGEDYARQGVSDIMDEVVRNPSSRLRTVVVVAYHSRAEDVMKLPYAHDRLPSDAIYSGCLWDTP